MNLPNARPRTNLHVVAPVVKPYCSKAGAKRVESLRRHLMTAAVRYVHEGNDGTVGDRLRMASDLSGIPKNLIEVELQHKAKAER